MYKGVSNMRSVLAIWTNVYTGQIFMSVAFCRWFL